eukprot:TRINITY_DN1309_c0_g1_i2.p1 TRINITY_DN1309_c0_g1~~TRINITY_DN1309_c0_g1_i2.p1  ORF type:complete len:155 (+),score=30.16 TRINITY_DN1309_c0_g1_i2:628-1092(+)
MKFTHPSNQMTIRCYLFGLEITSPFLLSSVVEGITGIDWSQYRISISSWKIESSEVLIDLSDSVDYNIVLNFYELPNRENTSGIITELLEGYKESFLIKSEEELTVEDTINDMAKSISHIISNSDALQLVSFSILPLTSLSDLEKTIHDLLSQE